MSTFRSFVTGCSCRKNKDILLVLPDIGRPGLPYEGIFTLLHIKKTFQGYLMEYNPNGTFTTLLNEIIRFIKKVRSKPIGMNIITHGLSHLFILSILKETSVDKFVILNPYWSEKIPLIEHVPSYIKETLNAYQKVKYAHPHLRRELLRFDIKTVNATFKECEKMTPEGIVEVPALIFLAKPSESQLDNIVNVYKKCRVESVQADDHIFFLSVSFRQFMNNILSEFL